MASAIFSSGNLTLRNAILAATPLRIVLIIYGDYHDRNSALKYTDIDYRVFSDASHFLSHPSDENMAQGLISRIFSWNLGDPYTRFTYRYTPMLALLTLPNEFLHPAFGKAVFALCDLLVGYLLYRIFLRVMNSPSSSTSKPLARSNTTPQSKTSTKRQQLAVAWIGGLWLVNPMVANISTRGSAESVLGAMVVSTLFLVLSDHLDWAAMLLGLSIHFKIYPIIYGASILAWIDRQTPLAPSMAVLTKKRIRFIIVTAFTFVLLNAAMFSLWGYPFLEHTYLYHLTRRDHRHNFSPYFYPMYISYTLDMSPNLLWSTRMLRNPLLSFLPQILLCAVAGITLGNRDLPFAWFVQTMVFVTFNKVCTSQYFMWYLWFLPLVLPKMNISVKRASLAGTVWVASQALWLAAAFRLELLGESVYVWVWTASIVFLLSNGFVLGEILKTFKFDTMQYT